MDSVGTVVRRARLAAGLKQEELGRMCGYSAGSISRMERGLQPMRDVQLLRGVAQALSIPLDLLGLAPDPPADPRHARQVPAEGMLPPRVGNNMREGGGWVDRRQMLAAGLAALGLPLAAGPLAAGAPASAAPASGGLAGRLLRYPQSGTRGPVSLSTVERMTGYVRARYEAGDFAALADQILPQAVDMAEAYASAATGDDGPAALALLSQTYTSTASTAIKLGRLDLAWVAADRATLAAGRSGDVLACAEAARQVSILSRKAGRPDETITVAVEAADRLRAAGLTTPDRVSAYGLLLLSAGYAAAVAGDRANYEELFTEASAAARILGDGVWHREFGAANVRIYQVSAEWALGNAGSAIAHARGLPGEQLPTPERTQRFWVDVSRAWRQWNKPVEAFRCLLAAEQAAPRAVRVRPVVHSMAAWLLGAPSTVGLSGVREFALRVGAA